MNKHSHYFKSLPCLTVDIYRVLHAFDVTDPCLQHAAKKIMVAGGRGAKDAKKDVEEAIDSLVRWLEMRREEGENMQGNDLKVTICDTMAVADSFLHDTMRERLQWTEQAYPKVEHQWSVDGVTWNDGPHYSTDAETIHVRRTEDDLRWGDKHEARIDVIGQNGPTGEHYQDNDGWIEWGGGECPVGDEVIVKAKLRDMTGHVEEFRCKAGDWMWDHQGNGSDIIAYKIIEAEAQ